MRVEYISILQRGLDLFCGGNSFDGRYLFALQVALSNGVAVQREIRGDGSLELRERDYALLEKILPIYTLNQIKKGESRVFPFNGPEWLDRLNLQVLQDVARGKAALLERAADTIDVD